MKKTFNFFNKFLLTALVLTNMSGASDLVQKETPLENKGKNVKALSALFQGKKIMGATVPWNKKTPPVKGDLAVKGFFAQKDLDTKQWSIYLDSLTGEEGAYKGMKLPALPKKAVKNSSVLNNIEAQKLSIQKLEAEKLSIQNRLKEIKEKKEQLKKMKEQLEKAKKV
jgi:hypothetical protein